MILRIYTLIHVVISLLGILSGFVVIFGMLTANPLVGAVLAQYFNVFVLVVQSFQKIPALKALAPTQKEPPFKVAQLVVLILFLVLGAMSVVRFRV